MRFPDKQTAIAYAELNNIAYQVSEPKLRRVKPRAYADNFAFTRKGAWTHWRFLSAGKRVLGHAAFTTAMQKAIPRRRFLI